MKPGWSLDLTRDDPLTGKPWDLGGHGTRERVRDLVRKSKPLLVIGSPPCTAFSRLQGLSRAKRDPKIVKEERRVAEGHIKFCAEVYKTQIADGRLFMHEHPHAADSWKLRDMTMLLTTPGVGMVRTDMCAFGMMSRDEQGEAPALKPTRILSNSREILKRVQK